MKKIWNLMLVALVMLGAAACTEKDANVDANEKAGFSFYAEVADATRATIEKDGEVWNTKWELGDKLYVTAGETSYEFLCTDVATGKFTCSADGVESLVGQPVTITTDGKHHSLQGKKALYTAATVESFGPDANIELEALTSFFRYTYYGEGEVKLTLSAAAFRNEAGEAVDEVVISGNGEQFVAFWPTGEEVTLTYAIDGVTVKETKKEFEKGMVYNLGDRSPVYKVYVYNYQTNWSNVYMYMWDDLDTRIFGDWPGSKASATETINGYEYMVWTIPTEHNGKAVNMILNNNAGSQTGDFALGTLDKDYYLLLNGTTISVVEDKENPEPEVVEGEPQPSSWALAGDFNSWGDKVMYTTDTADLFVAKSVAIGAYKEVKIKAVGNWSTSYGGGINYLNANVWTAVYIGGSNFSIVNAGTYDIYFDNANKRIYVMTEGTDVSAATHQSSNGAAPDLSGASWGLCGAHNNWGTPDIKLVWDGTIGLYVAKNAALKGEFKVRANESWGEDYGCGGTITVNSSTGKSMSRGGGNCKVTAGTYDVYWDFSGKKIWVKTPGSAAPTK